LLAPFVLDGPINAECFFAYVEQILAPASREGDTVIVDHLSSQKTTSQRASPQAPARAFCSCRPTAPTSIQS